MAYRVIETTLLAGQTISPTAVVPGRLIGVFCEVGAGSTLQVQINTTAGWADIVVNNSPFGGGHGGFKYLAVNFELPVGTTEYRMVFSNTDAANRRVQWYSEELPYAVR